MKVIYSVGTTLFGGGIGNTAYYGALGLQKNHALDSVLCMDYKKSEIPNQKIKTFKFLKYFDLPLGFARARFWSKLPQYTITNNLYDIWASTKVNKCDVFHGWMGMSLRQIKKAKKLGAKTIIECASSHPKYQRRLLQDEYKKYGIDFDPWENNIYNTSLEELSLADYIKIPSDFVRQTFIDKGVDPKRLIQVPFGANLERFQPKESYDKNNFNLIFVGSIGLRKGAQYLLQAFDELNLKDSRLYVVGAVLNDIRPIIKRYENNKNIIFTGHTNPIDYLRRADVFVFPSLEEGSALVSYEAMACGLASIATYSTGSVITDGEDGFVIESGNIQKLKQKIIYLYDNREMIEKMGKNARKHIEHYTWENHGEIMYKKYLEII